MAGTELAPESVQEMDVGPPITVPPAAAPLAPAESEPQAAEASARLYLWLPPAERHSSKSAASAPPKTTRRSIPSFLNLGLPAATVLALHVARYEIRSRYARSVLGSLWITVQQALFVGVAALVFPAVFNVPVASYITYFAVSLLLWSFMSSCILESMDSLTANGPMIKDRGFSPEVFLLSVFFKNLLVSAHALAIPVLLIVGLQVGSVEGLVLALPGLISILVFTGAMSYSAGLLAARYRDLKRLSESIIQLAFLVTPILWQRDFIGGHSTLIVDLNPLAHLFNAWRQPLLEGRIALDSLAVSALITSLVVFAALVMRRRVTRVAIWV
jgi:lipopolysaccharide transport system permease protein